MIIYKTKFNLKVKITKFLLPTRMKSLIHSNYRNSSCWLRLELILAFIIFLSMFQGRLWAEDSGQIINVNQNFKIAFTDLGSRVLKPNDIVKVFITRDEFLYMKVIECSPILSKLGTVQEDAFKTNLQDMPRISVGNLVVKLTAASREEALPSESRIETKIAAEPVPQPDPDRQKLEKELAEARVEIKNLKEINAALEAKVNDLVLKVQTKDAEKASSEQYKINDENITRIKIQLDKLRQLMNQD